jgi:hypothetical protein
MPAIRVVPRVSGPTVAACRSAAASWLLLLVVAPHAAGQLTSGTSSTRSVIRMAECCRESLFRLPTSTQAWSARSHAKPGQLRIHGNVLRESHDPVRVEDGVLVNDLGRRRSERVRAADLLQFWLSSVFRIPINQRCPRPAELTTLSVVATPTVSSPGPTRVAVRSRFYALMFPPPAHGSTQ